MLPFGIKIKSGSKVLCQTGCLQFTWYSMRIRTPAQTLVAGDKNATAVRDGSSAATVKGFCNVALKRGGGRPWLIGGHRAITVVLSKLGSPHLPCASTDRIRPRRRPITAARHVLSTSPHRGDSRGACPVIAGPPRL